MQSIILPSKPRIVSEEDNKGIYEIDGLYPGYGHTLGNSLRRIIISSLPGVAITTVRIEGVSHEFSTMSGMKEDIISLLLNLQRVRFRMTSDEPQKATLRVQGVREVTSGDIKIPGQVELLDKKFHLATLTEKGASLDIEMTLEKGLGYVPKELVYKDKIGVGAIALDAAFTPVKRANYEVENMRVGDRTDYNRLRIFIETDGVITAREVFEKAIDIMIDQLKAIRGFRTEEPKEIETETKQETDSVEDVKLAAEETLKTKIDDLGLSARTINALSLAGVRTVSGLARKKEEDLLAVNGLGEKGIKEIKRALSNFGIILK